jgi:hypothetical protein
VRVGFRILIAMCRRVSMAKSGAEVVIEPRKGVRGSERYATSRHAFLKEAVISGYEYE